MTAPRRVVCVGRFQPPTARHLACIDAALGAADEVVVVIGGAEAPRAVSNPWFAEERADMIRACFPRAGARLDVLALRDVAYDDARWARTLRARLAGHPPAMTGVMPCARRDIAAYAELFPDWAPIAPPPAIADDEDFAIMLFEAGALTAALAARLPAMLRERIAQDLAKPAFQALAAEWAHVRDYRASWRAAPFPPIFVTVDAVVTHGEAVLLIRRGRRPGLGLSALPGGFVDPGETLFDSALRELAEETGIALGTGALVATRVFDAPHRSLRGRTITHVFRFDLPPELEPPRVVGGDDAAAAHWVALSEVDPGEMFEDHYAILQIMLGID